MANNPPKILRSDEPYIRRPPSGFVPKPHAVALSSVIALRVDKQTSLKSGRICPRLLWSASLSGHREVTRRFRIFEREVDSERADLPEALSLRGFGPWCRDGGSNPDDPKVGRWHRSNLPPITSECSRGRPTRFRRRTILISITLLMCQLRVVPVTGRSPTAPGLALLIRRS